MSNSKSFGHFLARFAAPVSGAILLLSSSLLLAQSTINTGSIVGTVTDTTGAVVSGARVTITDKATGNVVTTTTTGTGTYASGTLTPGEYQVRIEAKGFKSVQFPASLQVNTTATANIKLEAGDSKQVVTLPLAQIGVDLEQATLQDVLTQQQIENLPINGRNFFDLAQLEPGVQIQDGGTFDPTKNGYSSVSFNSRFGRTARIEVDGIDVSDETVGTTTQNIPLGAIEEFGLQRSFLDLSTELTSSGSVNVVTQSGGNQLHGQGFYNFRDQVLNAALPGHSTSPFQRNQFGGSVGGAVIKDKLFFFANAERTKQDLIETVLPGVPFTNLTGSFDAPFRETNGIGRLDWLVNRYKVFYRFAYDQNKSVLPFLPNTYQPFASDNHIRSSVVGVDFATGSYVHSLRFGYTKFENGITDAVTGSNIFNPAPGLELAIGGDPNCLSAGLNAFCSGQSYLAPQQTFQSNHQIVYDGSRVYKNHIFRFGGGYNLIRGGGFAAFLGLAPAVSSPNLTPPCVTASNCPFPGGASNPLNYPAVTINLGNGEGFSSEKSAFGLPAGGLGPDNRISWYVGDSWKAKPTFTLTYGLGYVRDTGRTNSDIAPIPFLGQFDVSNQYYTYTGLSNRVRQPNQNFAPQVGFAWDPAGKGQTVVRGGVGLFYENSIWNNSLFDRPARLPQGLFLGSEPACTSGTAQALSFSTSISLNTICNQPIGNSIAQIVTLQQEYQAAVRAAGPSTNPGYIANAEADGLNITGTSLLAPAYVTPRSVQINFGIQREIRRGMVIAIDGLRNISTHTLLAIDTNHVGDFRFFNQGNAAAAIAAVEANCGNGASVQATLSNCMHNPALGPGDPNYGTPSDPIRPANISDYAKNGLDSGYGLCGGFPCPRAAFGGINPALGANQMLFPIGRSVYNGLQASLKQDVNNPGRWVKHMNLQASYTFSQYVSTSRDSDFIDYAYDNADPLKFIGPNALDRTHQISFGGFADVIKGFQLSLMAHFDSPLASDVRLPVSGNAGGIFQTDVTGDGTGDGTLGSNGGLGDLLPGTNVGGFGRSFGTNGLNQAINKFNTQMVGQVTPAGQAVLNSGLISPAQMVALGGTIMGGIPLQTAPAGAYGQTWLRTFDLGVNWSYKVLDRVQIRPGVTIFNLFNFANFDGPAVPFSSILNGTVGSPNGTTSALLHGVDGNFLRLGLGTGVNSLGAPRTIEFNLRVSF